MKNFLAALGLIAAASSCGIAHAAPDWNEHRGIRIAASPVKTRTGKVDWMASAGASLAAFGADITRYARHLAVPQNRPVFRGRGANPAATANAGAQTAAPVSASGAVSEISASPAKSASIIDKAEKSGSQPAAALYLGNDCTASRSVCDQFAADVAKEKIAQVTSDINGSRPSAGFRVRFRYKF